MNFDTRLFSIGLPDLRGAFGLSFDEGAWLSTVATGSQILVAPAIAWLATAFGMRRVMVVPSLIYTAASLGIPFIRNYQMLLIAHFIHGLLLGVFIPATIMIVLRNLPMRWWLPGLSIYAFRLAFINNTGVSLVGFYVQYLGWQWIYRQDAAVAVVMALLTWLGTRKRTSIANCSPRRIGAACCCWAPRLPCSTPAWTRAIGSIGSGLAS